MSSDLLQGFQFGPWKVEPLRGAITRSNGEAQHLEPKVMDVFVCLAEHANELVTREQLLETVWTEHVAADELLTGAVSDLRHALQDSRDVPKYIETVPKRGYRLIGDIYLLDGSRLKKDLKRSLSIAVPSQYQVAFLIVIALALGYFAFDKFVLNPSRDAELVQTTTEAAIEQAAESDKAETPDKSIAVLAFTDLSPEGDQEYFSDGISEELLNVLSKIPDLRVAARTSSFQFKGENRDIVDIGEQLNVSHILEGSVRKAGPEVRISAQLVDASNGFHLWSGTYDREVENIFALQDEISAAIVMALREHLGLQVEAAPRVIAAANSEAHDAYLRGRYLVVQRNPDTVKGAVREFEKAISHDPEYALAHAELAIAILLLRRSGYGVLTHAEANARAIPHAERAMELDPTIAEAYAAAALITWDQGNFDEALTHIRQAIQINPNYSIVYNWRGQILGEYLGRYAESFAAYEMALRVDPLSIPTTENYILALIERDRLAEADRELQKLASIAPGHYAHFRGALTSQNGKWANAVLAQLDALQINPESVPPKRDLTQYFAIIGLDKEALAISEAGRSVVLRILGRPKDLASIGDYARARPILEEMWQRSGGRVTRSGLFQNDSAAALIAIRRDAGEEAKVDELITAIRDNVRRYREAGITAAAITGELWMYSVDYEEGLAAYLAGEREHGLALIAKAVEDGFFIPQKEAYLQALYDNPGFAAIRASQEARQARERKKFLDIVCTDNPYEAVWQPAEGTCERFAAAGEN